MTDCFASDLPSPFVLHWARTLGTELPAPRRALDVAMGRGRHVSVLADSGFRVFGVDKNCEALRDARARAAERGHVLRAWCADLTRSRLPRDAFQLVLVTRYLQRDLFAAIREALTPRGAVIYETFTRHQRSLGVGPSSADHLLEPEELRERFEGMEIVFYEEVRAPEAVARLVARSA